MLKNRVIGVLVLKAGIVVQSVQFKRYLPVGSPTIAVEYLNRWGIDEIILLDIDATPESRRPSYDVVRECSKFCQVPLSVGGGITDVKDIEKLIHSGADKVVLNTAAVKTPGLITEAARLFGSQCLIVSIDARPLADGCYEVLTTGQVASGLDPVALAKRVAGDGAGEILLNAVERDGTKKGYDLELIRPVVSAVSIPVIVVGGVGHPQDFLAALELGAAAVAAANFFHFTEHSVIVAKGYLKDRQADIRLDTYATYEKFAFDSSSRAAKLEDAILEQLRFAYIPEEVI